MKAGVGGVGGGEIKQKAKQDKGQQTKQCISREGYGTVAGRARTAHWAGCLLLD